MENMPNPLQAALSRHAPAMLARAGVRVTWKGKEYSAMVADPSALAELEAGGFAIDGDFVLKIPRASFTGTFPAINDQIAMDGKIYRVTADRQKPGSAFVVIPVSS